MTFNLTLFAKLTFRSLFGAKSTHGRLTPKRLRTLSIFYFLFFLLEAAALIGFFLDEIFFRGYRKQRVKEPVFIIGNYRSGSTLLHRLLAEDRHAFSSMITWEIYFAPSVTQRKAFRALGMLDRWLGRPIHRYLDSWEGKVLSPIEIHRMKLTDPEEDEGLFLYIWAGLFVWFFFPFIQRDYPFDRFDSDMPGPKKRRIMRFYRNCIKRHLFHHGGTYLAKNPALSPKVDSLFEFFPDAKIIYLARNPMEVLPSELSWLSFCWRFFSDPLERYPFKDFVLRMAKHWYTDTVKRLQAHPSESWRIIRYDDLVEEPEKTVEEIYSWLGLEMGKKVRDILREKAERKTRFKSNHIYSLEEVGLTREIVLQEYGDVFQAFDFEKSKEAIKS
jgi:hypothetical protein